MENQRKYLAAEEKNVHFTIKRFPTFEMKSVIKNLFPFHITTVQEVLR